MDSSFTAIEQMLKFRASRHEDFPYQEILLTRLCMHMQGKLLDNRNKMLKAQGINGDVIYGVDYAGVSGKPQYSAV
ncbi:Transcriptional regulators [Enterobacter cloacae]|uniref:Transcriptional regulators n=1 Tax=Enterobacter cloacae TaxID=550 RepID=A0A377LTM2_ENTCL|nr:Transcriptional regulators [Enterobacter cloacae]